MRVNRGDYNFSAWTQPVFAANDTWGTVSTANEGMPAWKALDGDANTQWETTKLTAAAPVDFIWTFEKPLAISQIYLMNKKSGGVYVTKSVNIYADLEKTDLIISSAFELKGQSVLTLPVDVCTDCLVFECYPNDGYSSNMYVGFSEILLTAEVGEATTITIDNYLNTTEGMEILVNNTKKDDDTITVAGADWFQYNGKPASNLYVSGNSWIGIGESAEHLKICRRDGAMFYLYRQEGKLYNYYRFLKIRWEGYTQYNSTDVSRKLIYEFFLFDTGDMFLNVVQTPTNSSYIGTSALVCNGVTTNLDIPISSTPMITFVHQDAAGLSWAVNYEKIVLNPPYDMRYLIKDASGKYYTVANGALSQAGIGTLNAQAFRDHGMDALRSTDWMLITGLIRPKILYWQDTQEGKPKIQADVTAFPVPQEITVEADMTHESISGIRLLSANYSGQVGVRYAAGGSAYTDEMTLDDFLQMDVTELWEDVQPGRRLQLIFVLHGDAALTTFQISYNNYGG